MQALRQGDVWICDLGESGGRRPVVIVTRSRAPSFLTNVTVVPLARAARVADAIVPLDERDGLRVQSYATADNITTIAIDDLESRVGRVRPAKLAAILESVRVALDIPS